MSCGYPGLPGYRTETSRRVIGQLIMFPPDAESEHGAGHYKVMRCC